MAIKISGTTVIDDSRDINNIGILTVTTIADGSGDVGTAASVLSSTGSGLEWVAQSGGGAGGLWESNITGINTSTNVGIGTTTASDATLTVDVGTASTAIVVQGSEGRLFSVTNSLSSGSIFSVNDISGIPSIDVNADGTIQLAPYSTTEYIGVGTTNPTRKLDVRGDIIAYEDSTGSARLVDSGNIELTNNNGAIIDFKTSDSEDFDCRIRQQSDGLQFMTGGNGSTAEALRITSDGKVGIGTDNPDELLELGGTDPVLKIHDFAGGATNGFTLKHDGVDATIDLQSAGLLTIKQANGTTNSQGIVFNTGNSDTERLRIASNGHVGINSTIPGTRLDVVDSSASRTWDPLSSSVAMFERNGSSIITIVGNASGTCGIDFGDTNDDNRGYIHYDHSDNSMLFRTNADEALRINSDGDVGIGTDNPTGAAALTGNEAVLAVGVVTTNTLYVNGTEVTGGGGGAGGLWESNTTGINTSTNVAIGNTIASDATLVVDVGTASTAIVVKGSQGQLFSVTNSLSSGSIFSVNDITGIPSIDVDADGTIQLAPYSTTENVGVGTTNPAEKLDVAGHIKVDGGPVLENASTLSDSLKITTSTGYVEVGSQNASYTHIYTDRSKFYFNKRIIVDEGIIASYNEDLVLATGISTERLRIRDDGDVLIGGHTQGASDPSKLSVFDSGSNIGIIQVHCGTEDDGDLAGITFGQGGSNATARSKTAIAAVSTLGYGRGDLCFYVDGAADNNPVSTADEKLRITGTGSVGIGTTNPGALLHLYSTNAAIKLTDSNQAADNKSWSITAGNTQLLRIQGLNDAGGGGGNYFDFYRSGNQVNELRGAKSANTWFVVDNANKHVGIGTDNPDTLLTLYSDAADEELLHFNMGSPENRRGWKFEQLNTDTSTGLKLKANVNSKPFEIHSADDTLHFKVHTGSSNGYVAMPVKVGIADNIYHIGDDNTNIRFPANDTFVVETGGSERLRINSSGLLVNGSIKNIESIVNYSTTSGGTDAGRTEGSYTIIDAGGSVSGTSADFVVDIDSNGAATVTMTSGGTGYAVDETITIAKADIGGGSADLVITVSSITSTPTFNDPLKVNLYAGNGLGETEDDELDIAEFKSGSNASGGSNAVKLLIQNIRVADGADWTSTATRIQRRVDSTDMGYIDFGTGSGGAGSYIMFGNGGYERLCIKNNGALCLPDDDNSADGYGQSGQVLTSNGNAAPTWQDGGGGGDVGVSTNATYVGTGVTNFNFVGTGITASLTAGASADTVANVYIPSATRTTNRYIATADQTTFNATYTVGYVDVFLNGIKLDGQDEFTATNGTSVVLTDGATVNDIIEIVAQQISANLTITGITDVFSDTSPQLGGDLDINGKEINGTGDVNLTGIVTATKFVGAIETSNATITGGTYSGNVDLSGLLKEGVNIVANKLSAANNISLSDGMVHLFTTEETTTSTPNIRFDGSTALNAKMSTGEAVTVVIIVTADATGYSAQLTIDGSAVTEEWLGGSAPTEGGAGGYDVYTHNIIKTADATFVVLSNLVNFA